MQHTMHTSAARRARTIASVIFAGFLFTACSQEAVVKPSAKGVASANSASPSSNGSAAADHSSAGAIKLTADSFNAKDLKIIEGTDYKKLKHPQPVAVAGKAEVAEFFWYGCGHCFAAEPYVQAWNQYKPAGVNFVRYHPQWNGAMKAHQRMAMAVRVLNKTHELDGKIFNEIQNGGDSLVNEESIAAFMAKNGVDRATWDGAYKSFEVNALIVTSDGLFKAYELDGVPKFVVNGKYLVEGGGVQAFKVINKLLEQAP